jgi:Xaa-Pro aminopeptidase
MTPAQLTRLREWMATAGVESVYISNPVNIAYLSGFRGEPGERTMALVVTDAQAVLLVPALEAESAVGQATGVEVVGWQDGQDPHRAVEPLLAGISRLAVEKGHLSLGRSELLQSRFGIGHLLDAGDVLAGFRLLKSEAEVEGLATAALLTDTIVEAALAALRPGLSELEVAAAITALIAGVGAKPSFETIVQSGPNSALPHLRPTRRQLAEGDLVLLDLGAAQDGYHGDITRMAVIGKPDERQLEVHDAVLRAHDEAVAAIRPGVTAGEVDEAARRVLREAGLGENFIHRVGHGLGLECHEAPSLDPGSDLVLEAGMVVTVEPGAYIPGWGGVRIEDDVVVTDNGARLLTSVGHSLRAVPLT